MTSRTVPANEPRTGTNWDSPGRTLPQAWPQRRGPVPSSWIRCDETRRRSYSDEKDAPALVIWPYSRASPTSVRPPLWAAASECSPQYKPTSLTKASDASPQTDDRSISVLNLTQLSTVRRDKKSRAAQTRLSSVCAAELSCHLQASGLAQDLPIASSINTRLRPLCSLAGVRVVASPTSRLADKAAIGLT